MRFRSDFTDFVNLRVLLTVNVDQCNKKQCHEAKIDNVYILRVWVATQISLEVFGLLLEVMGEWQSRLVMQRTAETVIEDRFD